MKECTCERCVSACKRLPGWFMFGEAEITAKNLGLTLKEFFDKHLVVDFWVDIDSPDYDSTTPHLIYVLAPAKINDTPGTQVEFLRRHARCGFLKNDRCEIHTIGKPFECRETMCCDPRGALAPDGERNRKKCAISWDNAEGLAQITELLGHAPAPKRASLKDSLIMLFEG